MLREYTQQQHAVRHQDKTGLRTGAVFYSVPNIIFNYQYRSLCPIFQYYFPYDFEADICTQFFVFVCVFVFYRAHFVYSTKNSYHV